MNEDKKQLKRPPFTKPVYEGMLHLRDVAYLSNLDREGPYRHQVRRALDWIDAMQSHRDKLSGGDVEDSADQMKLFGDDNEPATDTTTAVDATGGEEAGREDAPVHEAVAHGANGDAGVLETGAAERGGISPHEDGRPAGIMEGTACEAEATALCGASTDDSEEKGGDHGDAASQADTDHTDPASWWGRPG